jgi:hypothetical protein
MQMVTSKTCSWKQCSRQLNCPSLKTPRRRSPSVLQNLSRRLPLARHAGLPCHPASSKRRDVACCAALDHTHGCAGDVPHTWTIPPMWEATSRAKLGMRQGIAVTFSRSCGFCKCLQKRSMRVTTGMHRTLSRENMPATRVFLLILLAAGPRPLAAISATILDPPDRWRAALPFACANHANSGAIERRMPH